MMTRWKAKSAVRVRPAPAPVLLDRVLAELGAHGRGRFQLVIGPADRALAQRGIGCVRLRDDRMAAVVDLLDLRDVGCVYVLGGRLHRPALDSVLPHHLPVDVVDAAADALYAVQPDHVAGMAVPRPAALRPPGADGARTVMVVEPLLQFLSPVLREKAVDRLVAVGDTRIVEHVALEQHLLDVGIQAARLGDGPLRHFVLNADGVGRARPLHHKVAALEEAVELLVVEQADGAVVAGVDVGQSRDGVHEMELAVLVAQRSVFGALDDDAGACGELVVHWGRVFLRLQASFAGTARSGLGRGWMPALGVGASASVDGGGGRDGPEDDVGDVSGGRDERGHGAAVKAEPTHRDMAERAAVSPVIAERPGTRAARLAGQKHVLKFSFQWMVRGESVVRRPVMSISTRRRTVIAWTRARPCCGELGSSASASAPYVLWTPRLKACASSRSRWTRPT